MGYYYANMMGGGLGIFCLITWIALMAFLITGTMYFWKNMKKGR